MSARAGGGGEGAVVAGAAVDAVGAGAAVEEVVAVGAAEEAVVAVAAEEHVAVGAAEEAVVPVGSGEHVTAGAAAQYVVVVAATSEPDTEPTSWDATRAVLETAELTWISTVRANGRPHVTPLVAVWLDGAYHFSTGRAEQKGINLETNPNVVLMTGCNHWDQGLDVMVEGRARRVTDRATLERLATARATKWAGFWQYEVTDEGFRQPDPTSDRADGVHSVVYAVEPSKVLALGKRPFTHTRHLPPTVTSE